jgi:hypothetical protein
MSTTAAAFYATDHAPAASALTAALGPLTLPPGLPPGARITLLADYHRAADAIDLAQALANGTLHYDSAGYTHLRTDPDPQHAAAHHAILDATDLTNTWHTALTAATAATRAANARHATTAAA